MLVQDDLVLKLSQYLTSGAYIYLSSDSDRVILWMIHKFLHNDHFKLIKSVEVSEIPNHVFFTTNSIVPSSSMAHSESPEIHDDDEEEGGEENEDELEQEDDDENETNEINKLNEYWIDYNPLGELSERELICEVDWRRVKRCILMRC